MPITNDLNSIGLILWRQLTEFRSRLAKHRSTRGRKISVSGVGAGVTAVYEQLRNASEYAEEHLLVQKALRRFYKRTLSFHHRTVIDTALAEEVITELTQAGYLENNTQAVEVIEKLEKIINKHYETYWQLAKSGAGRKKAEGWTLDLLSVESEELIAKPNFHDDYIQFAYQHYLDNLDRSYFAQWGGNRQGYEACLYMAVDRILARSDLANIRYDMLKLYQITSQDIKAYKKFHASIDKTYHAELTDQISRYINKYGAPLRVLKDLVERNPDSALILPDRQQFMSAYESQIYDAYKDAKQRLNKGVIKSIAFIIITKTILGIAVEIPYDLAVMGHVAIWPLIVNLITPVVYLFILRLGLKLPGSNNTATMQDFIQNTLYVNTDKVRLYPRPRRDNYPIGFKIVYGLMFLIVFSAVIYQLVIWRFNIVQGVIFIIFLATVSFLGFRLSRIIRELEIVAARPSFLTVLRDFIYMPFIALGQWLSAKYSELNIVALVLDRVIEMPLKSVLRLVRQWVGFMSEKQDQI